MCIRDSSTSDSQRVQEIYGMILNGIADQNLLVPVTGTHDLDVYKRQLYSRHCGNFCRRKFHGRHNQPSALSMDGEGRK